MTKINLNIYPWGMWEQYRDIFRKAKQGSTRLVDVVLQPVEAKPGCGRLVAFGERPPFAAEYIVVRKKPGEFDLALAERLLDWYVGNHKEPLATSVAGWLSITLGREVVEVG